MNPLRLLTFLFFGFLSMGFFPIPSQAQVIHVYFSEIAWVGSSLSTSDEWLELYNPLEETVDLSGWSLEGAASSQGTLIIPSGSFIEPGQTFLISNYGADNEKSTLTTIPNYVTSDISLSNSSFKLILKNTEGVAIDLAGDGNAPFAGGSQDDHMVSMHRIDENLDGSLPEAWGASEISLGFDEGIVDLGTPGSLEIISQETEETIEENDVGATLELPSEEEIVQEENGESTSVDLQTIIINELVSDPVEGVNEWIELYHAGEEPLSLTGWTLTEAGGKIFSLPEQTLQPGEYLVIEMTSSVLNNSGDTVTLYDSLGILVNQVIYGTETIPAVNDPHALARTESGTFLETASPTPGEINVFEEEIADEPLEDPIESDVDVVTTEEETIVESSTEEIEEILSYPVGTLLINEFVSDPVEGEKEWVEIYNPQNEIISLTGWSIQEGAGKTYALPEGSLQAGGYIVIEISSSSLNNSGDTITLLDPSGFIVDEIIYGTDSIPAPNDPNALGRTDDGMFLETTTPTPGEKNSFTEEEIKETEVLEEEENNSEETLSETETSSTSTSSNSSGSSGSSTSSSTQQTALSYSEGTLLINEFVSDPVSGEKEWVEIYNTTTASISLQDWYLKEASGKKFAFDVESISANGYVVLEFSSGNLNNDGDTITLLDPSGNSIDSVIYGTDTIPSVDDPYALAKNSEGTFLQTALLTPEEQNQFEAQEDIVIDPVLTNETVESSQMDTEEEITDLSATTQTESPFIDIVFFSEIYPNTIGSDETQEFIELHHTGTTTLSLLGWKLQDLSGKNVTLPDILLSPGMYLALERPQTALSLNNVGKETVFLYDQNGLLVDELSYANAPKGASYAKFEKGFLWTTAITRNQQNTFQEPILQTNPSPAKQGTTTASVVNTTLSDVRNLEIGTRVRLRGIVSASPGMLGNQIFYLSGSGIQVYKHDGEFPEMPIGDEIEITGTLSSNRGEMRIKLGDEDTIVFLASGMTPSLHPVSELNESLEGFLVQVEGRVISRSKDRLMLETTDAQILVRAKENTDLSLSSFEAGDLVQITGIVSQVDETYSLLVRSQEDIVLLEASAPASGAVLISSGKDLEQEKQQKIGFFLLLGVLLSLGIFGGHYFFKKRHFYEKRPLSLSPAGKL